MKNLIRKYQRYQAKRTPSLLAGVLFLLGGGAFVGNIPIEGYASTLIGAFLMLAAIVIHLESMGNQQAEQVRLLEELADAEGDS
jgi:hypothetical protein